MNKTNVAQALLDWANGNGESMERNLAALDAAHPALQQKIMRFFLGFCRNMAATQGDERNQNAIQLAQAIVALPEAKNY